MQETGQLGQGSFLDKKKDEEEPRAAGKEEAHAGKSEFFTGD